MRIACSFLVILVAALFLCSGAARAESPYRMEAFASVGAASKFVIFGQSSTDLNLGGGFGFRPFSKERSRPLRMLGGEFEANTTRMPQGSVSYFTANILLHGSIGDAEPYFLLGGGVAHAGSSTHRAGDVGFGLKLFITPKISVRPEFRVMATEYIGNFIRGSAAVGYHW